MLELVMSSFIGVFTVSVITLLGAMTMSLVNFARRILRKPPIIKNSTVSAVGYASIIVIVVEIVLVFVLF